MRRESLSLSCEVVVVVFGKGRDRSGSGGGGQHGSPVKTPVAARTDGAPSKSFSLSLSLFFHPSLPSQSLSQSVTSLSSPLSVSIHARLLVFHLSPWPLT